MKLSWLFLNVTIFKSSNPILYFILRVFSWVLEPHDAGSDSCEELCSVSKTSAMQRHLKIKFIKQSSSRHVWACINIIAREGEDKHFLFQLWGCAGVPPCMMASWWSRAAFLSGGALRQACRRNLCLCFAYWLFYTKAWYWSSIQRGTCKCWKWCPVRDKL